MIVSVAASPSESMAAAWTARQTAQQRLLMRVLERRIATRCWLYELCRTARIIPPAQGGAHTLSCFHSCNRLFLHGTQQQAVCDAPQLLAAHMCAGASPGWRQHRPLRHQPPVTPAAGATPGQRAQPAPSSPYSTHTTHFSSLVSWSSRTCCAYSLLLNRRGSPKSVAAGPCGSYSGSPGLAKPPT